MKNKMKIIPIVLCIASMNVHAQKFVSFVAQSDLVKYEIKSPTKKTCVTSLTRSELENVIATGTISEIENACTGDIEDFSMLFFRYDKNPDISGWDVSSAKTMKSMFVSTKTFNQDLSSWDVSNVQDFSGMFKDAYEFNGDISSWDVSNGTIFKNMFLHNHKFNQDIGSWDVSNGTDFDRMFEQSMSFNHDLSEWNVDKATTHRDFYKSSILNPTNVPARFK